ncbi:LURP-one-related/scramblase family protein [Nocardiopsis potens]|uniref:LURP-one-related/scramblase family protein n=1 Tax=Nocardiopsis potens TaxID=1246458 RepID=UPI000475A03F|nr:LURP-one-related family protein [Nocardiopsis potens]
MKYLVRERIFDIGDDFWVTDEEDNRIYWVDGKAMRLRTTFQLKTPDGEPLLEIKEKLLHIRDQMRITRDDELVATVRERMFNPIKEKLIVELAAGGEWEVHGDLLGKEYVISDEQGTVAHISKKWFRVRDTYAVDANTHRPDIAADPALVIAVAVAVDSLTEDGREEEEEEEQD